MLDETAPGVAEKRREAEGWVEMARAQGWYEPDDAVDAELPYLSRLGWDDDTWRANEHSFGLLLGLLRPGQRVLEVGAAKCWGAQHVIARGCTYVGTDILADANVGLGRGRSTKRGRAVPARPGRRREPAVRGRVVRRHLLRRHAPPRARPRRDGGRARARDEAGGHVLALNEGTRAVWRSGDALTRRRSAATASTSTSTRSTPTSGLRAPRPRRAPDRAGGRLRGDEGASHRRRAAPPARSRP